MFQALAERQRQRSYADADFIITSNSEVTKAKWRGYLTSALNLLTPLAFVVPGLAPLLAVGGIAQLGLGLDQAINGKTLQDKADGVGNIAYGLFNATPLVVEGLAKGSALFRVKSDGFVLPSRVNDQLGYPLGPVDPPRLPEVEVAPTFTVQSVLPHWIMAMPPSPAQCTATLDTLASQIIWPVISCPIQTTWRSSIWPTTWNLTCFSKPIA